MTSSGASFVATGCDIDAGVSLGACRSGPKTRNSSAVSMARSPVVVVAVDKRPDWMLRWIVRRDTPVACAASVMDSKDMGSCRDKL